MTAEVPARLDSMQSTKTLFSERTGTDDPDWMRAWPFGPVHYSQDWSARRDGRFDTVCGKAPIFWPETFWPEHEACPECRAWVEEHGTPVPMQYDLRRPAPASSKHSGFESSRPERGAE